MNRRTTTPITPTSRGGSRGTPQARTCPRVLIVDDCPENIAVLTELLGKLHYSLQLAVSGEMALQLIEQERPDIVLLDIMLPGISGYAVCQKIKENPALADLPIIFLSVLSDLDHKLEGFSAGGVDYITKPFEQNEVQARIETHLNLAHLRAELEQRNSELDAFAHTVAHDLNSVLNIVANSSCLLESMIPAGAGARQQELIETIRRCAFQATDIVSALLLLANTTGGESFAEEYCAVAQSVTRALERVEKLVQVEGAKISQPEAWPNSRGYTPWVEEVWFNYLSNALKYGGSPPTVRLGAREEGEFNRFWVEDNGAGLSDEEYARLFTPFVRLHKERVAGHGLGLSIVERIVSRLGGEVGVERIPTGGSRFYFTLPAYHSKPAMRGVIEHDTLDLKPVDEEG